ncbi:hypothetical protein D029_4833A, partial [Vibrio parahaemolyticus 970107]
MYPCSTPLNDR